MNPNEQFQKERFERIQMNAKSKNLVQAANIFMHESIPAKYSYNFSWMGRPIIQYPQDMMATQEILWVVQPDLVIETGIAHGGSLIFYASVLELIGKGKVLGIDIEIRPHNRQAIESHPMFKRISMIEGSSISEDVLKQVRKTTEGKQTILVVLDSNHTHKHVLKELELYSAFVTRNSYLIVFDTIIEDMPNEFFLDRPWAKGDNPKTALLEFLKTHDEFVVDEGVEHKLLITVAPCGYLKRIRD